MLLGYALIHDQLMEVAEKSGVLEADEHYIVGELARPCRYIIPNPEEWVGAYLQLRNDASICKKIKSYFEI